jgi:hypothetical protein
MFLCEGSVLVGLELVLHFILIKRNERGYTSRTCIKDAWECKGVHWKGRCSASE